MAALADGGAVRGRRWLQMTDSLATGHGAKTSRQRDLALEALVKTGTVAGAAEAAGVSAKTVRRWLQKESFAAAYARLREEAFSHAIGALQGGLAEAVEVLREAMHGPNKAIAVTAARALLEHALRAAELVEITARFAELEKLAGEVAGNQGELA
jgi:hypothetical protein